MILMTPRFNKELGTMPGAPPGECPAAEKPPNRGPLPGRTYEAEAALARVHELMHEYQVGRGGHRAAAIGVAVRDTVASPRLIIGFSGSQAKVEDFLNFSVPGNPMPLQERLEQAGFVTASSTQDIPQGNPALRPFLMLPQTSTAPPHAACAAQDAREKRNWPCGELARRTPESPSDPEPPESKCDATLPAMRFECWDNVAYLRWPAKGA